MNKTLAVVVLAAGGVMAVAGAVTMKNDMDADGSSGFEFTQHDHSGYNAQDAHYLDALDGLGIYPDEDAAVHVGHGVCEAIHEAGHFRREFNIDVIAKHKNVEKELTRAKVGEWHDLIVDTYCPEVPTYPY